jgi:hypothetical protein
MTAATVIKTRIGVQLERPSGQAIKGFVHDRP